MSYVAHNKHHVGVYSCDGGCGGSYIYGYYFVTIPFSDFKSCALDYKKS